MNITLPNWEFYHICKTSIHRSFLRISQMINKYDQYKTNKIFFFNLQAVCSTMVTATLAVATLVCCQRHLAAAVCRSQHSFEKACWPARWRVKRSTTSTRATPKRTLRSSKWLHVWWKLPREVFIFPHIICQRIQQWTPDRNTASVIPLHPRVIVRPKRA